VIIVCECFFLKLLNRGYHKCTLLIGLKLAPLPFFTGVLVSEIILSNTK